MLFRSLHGAQDDRARVRALVAHHAHAADVGQHRKVLPHGPLDYGTAGAPALDLAVWLAALLETKGGDSGTLILVVYDPSPQKTIEQILQTAAPAARGGCLSQILKEPF